MKLAVKEYGASGTRGDVVLIHGTGARAEMWAPQIRILEKAGWHCIVPDLRGHGESHEPGDRTDLELHLQDISETLNLFEMCYPAVFVGHSLGSIISLELAALRPELVSKILAVSLPGKVPWITVSAFEAFLKFPYQTIRNTPIHRNLGWREQVLLDTNHHALKQILENFKNLDYLAQLPEVQCPVHFAVGRLDPVAPWQHVESMHKKLAGSSFKLIEWAGHNCMDSQPVEFNKWFKEKMECTD